MKNFTHFDDKKGHRRGKPHKIEYSSKKVIIDKKKLRNEINIATVQYLKNNKIKHLPNSPNAKVPSVRIRELGEISDSQEFYYLEEQIEYNLY